MVQFLLTWAEDRATVGTDPSADPGAKTEGGGLMPPSFFSHLRDWHQCVKSQGVWGRIPQGLAPRGDRILFQRSAFQRSMVRLIIMVSFAGSLAAVLVSAAAPLPIPS